MSPANDLPMVGGTLDRTDVVLRFDQSGQGPAALLLHAGGERRLVWHPIMVALDRRSLAAVAYDQRGHGESGGTRDTALPPIAADTAAMIDRLTMPVIVGASLGGFAALSALSDLEVQRRVAGIVLVDVLPDPNPNIVRAFLDSKGRNRRHAFQVEDILARSVELRASAASLCLPVLVVRAGLATPVRDEDARRFLDLVPHAVFVTVHDAGHLVAQDRPERLAEIIGDFLLKDVVRDRRIGQFLLQKGTDTIPHPGGTLAGHLHRTGDMLRSWQAPTTLVDAGRLHTAYGTDSFSSSVADEAMRETIVAIVGNEAERVIELYCRCDRVRSYPTWQTDEPLLVDRHNGKTEPLSDAMRRSLMELAVANELDVMKHSPEHRESIAQSKLPAFMPWHPFVSDGCRAAILSMH